MIFIQTQARKLDQTDQARAEPSPSLKHQAFRNPNIYSTRFLWSCAICWIIFACHHLKTGGYIRSFLSLHFWQPLSKLCLSVYLVHYIYINFLETDSFQPLKGFSVFWMIQISAGDILISFFLGALFHVVVEAPITNLITFCFERKSSEDKFIEKNTFSRTLNFNQGYEE